MAHPDSDNVTSFPAPPAPPEPPVKLSDEWIFRSVCDWKVARAKQQIAWAEHERATLLGHRSDDGPGKTGGHPANMFVGRAGRRARH